jgi:hypothetical protein
MNLNENPAVSHRPEIAIIGSELPNIPWEDRPSGCKDVIWRSTRNPIILRNQLPTSNSIFNSAVVPFEGKLANSHTEGMIRESAG